MNTSNQILNIEEEVKEAEECLKDAELLLKNKRYQGATAAAKGILKDNMGVRNEVVVTTDTAFTIEPETASWAREELARQGCDLAKATHPFHSIWHAK